MLTAVNDWINGVVWGPIGLCLLGAAGVWFTVYTGGFQLRYAGHWLRCTVGALFADGEVRARPEQDGHGISQFQSVCTSLAATIGTGSIVGVASAIAAGGPGAVFWMWAMALLGTMTAYAERVLGICYRRKDSRGAWVGGAMYYLRDGLGRLPGCRRLGQALAALFSLFCALACFGIGNIAQVNSIAGSMTAAFGVPAHTTGLVLTVVTGLVVAGGLQRVAAVTERLVPFVAVVYLAGAAVVIAVNIRQLPAALEAILRGAFGLRAAGGGLVGYGARQAVVWGLKRGAFSNEAGLGSAVAVACSAHVTEPVQQGMWGIFEVCVDTLVVCTVTALVILTSGVVDLQTGAVCGTAGEAALVGQAFGSVFGGFGPKFIALAILLFAYSTVLGWCCSGTTAFGYLFGQRLKWLYREAFVLLTYSSATMPLRLAWQLCDTLNGLMMLPNLVGVLALSGTVKAVTRNYLARVLDGADLPPLRSALRWPDATGPGAKDAVFW